MKTSLLGTLFLIASTSLRAQTNVAAPFDASSARDAVSAIKTLQLAQLARDAQTKQSQASMAAERIASFQQETGGLIAGINAMDKGSSPDAATQYQKDLNMLAQVAQWRASGNPNDPSEFSLASLQADLTLVNADLTQAQAGLIDVSNVPVQFAGTLIAAVPGPKVNVTNATPQQTLQILAARRAYWQAMLASYKGKLDAVKKMLDPNDVRADEFGLSHGDNRSLASMASLHASNPAAGSKADALADIAQLDAVAAVLNATTGSRIPTLSGLSSAELQAAMKTYATALEAVKFPAAAPAARQAQMDLILAARLAPMAERAVSNWSADQATVDDFNRDAGPDGALTAAKAGLTSVVDMVNAILADTTLDQTLIRAHIKPEYPFGIPFTPAEDAAITARKTALLNAPAVGIIPALTQAQGALTALTARQQESIADVWGADSRYHALFSGEQALMTQTQTLYNRTLPWFLASFGGSPGDVSASMANIAAWKQSLNENMIGGIDSNGQYREGLVQAQADLQDRSASSGRTRTEVVDGEVQPYALPAKIAQYSAETAARAREINAQGSTINALLAKIQTLSGGKYDLAAYVLPTGIGADAASAAKVRAVDDAKTIPNLEAALKTIGGAARAVIGSGGGAVPVGAQPAPTLSNDQQIALLALAAAERLLPAPNGRASDANVPVGYSVARYLYSSSIASAAQAELTTQVPIAAAFLQRASKALADGIAQTSRDAAYVQSNGASESANSLYARKIEVFQEAAAVLSQAAMFYNESALWDQAARGASETVKRGQQLYKSLTNS